MATKYICMKTGCDFVSDNEVDARDHMEESGEDHTVVEIAMANDTPICSVLGLEDEEMEDASTEDIEEMSDEEERA